MHIVEDSSNEELVRAARSAHAAGDSTAFRAAAGQLLEQSQQFIASKVTQKLRPANLLALSEDAAAEIQRRILEDLQAPRQKRGMDIVFHLYGKLDSLFSGIGRIWIISCKACFCHKLFGTGI